MNKIIITFLLLLSTSCYAEHKYKFSVCAIFRDEAPYLKEWLEYHKLVGVDHFYLYNHYSKDNYQEVLKPYIQDGTVELEDELTVAEGIKAFYPMQCKCYTKCLNKSKGISKWVAFIDIDEFIVPVSRQLLPNLMRTYEDCGGVAVNWVVFGTSNVKKIPKDKLLIETLTLCSDTSFWANRYVKSIVRPEHTSHFETAHVPIYLEDYCGVNTDKLPFGDVFSDYVRINKLRINHYWTRDEDFFYNKKIARQENWGGQPNPQNILKKVNVKKDDLILRYVPALRKAVFKEEAGK